MIVDITRISTVVRRLDVAATLKAFFALLGPFLVVWNVSMLRYAYQVVSLQYPDDWSDLDDDFLTAGFVLLSATLATLAPLGFIVTDWAARRPTSRYLSVITGSLLGALGCMLVGAMVGSIAVGLEENTEPLIGPSVATEVLVAASVLLVATAAWMATSSRRVEWLLAGVVALPLVAAIGVGLHMLWVEDELASAQKLEFLLLLVAIALWSWWLVRAVFLRLVLSGGCPRTILLGAFHRRGFWVRMAFLVGLPSSMWSLRAMASIAFWPLIVARPVVYLGVAWWIGWVSFADADPLQSTLGGIGLIVVGHLLFYAGKRLAARAIWKPGEESDGRAPILFLRSFQDDQLSFRRPVWDLARHWLDLWSFRRNADEMLIDEIAQYGPVVALGRPGEQGIPFGAMRHYATHDTWQALIVDTARRAAAIIIVAGDTEGVRSEFDLLAREKLTSKAVVLFRPGADALELNRRVLATALHTLRADARFEFPPHRQPVALLDSAGTPLLLTAAKPAAAAYLIAIRAHFQHIDAVQLELATEALEAPTAPAAVKPVVLTS